MSKVAWLRSEGSDEYTCAVSGEWRVGPVLVLALDDGVLLERRAGAVEDQFVKAGTPINWFVREDRVVEA